MNILDSQKSFLAKYGTKEHLDKLVNDGDWSVRVGVASNPNASKEHLDKLINDEYWVVRYYAASHPKATKEHLDNLINDKHTDVRIISKALMVKRFPK